MEMNLIPAEFTYKNFLEFIQEVKVDETFTGSEIFPEVNVFGQKVRNTILNLSREIIKEGARNYESASYNVDKLSYIAKDVEMFPFVLNHIFSSKDFLFLNNLGQKDRQIAVSQWLIENSKNLKLLMLRTWEYYRFQLLLNGGILNLTDNANGIHYYYDFGVDSSLKVAANTLTTTAKWDDYTTGISNPLKNLQVWRKKIKDAGGDVENIEIWANSNTWEVFRGNPKVTSDATLNDTMKGALLAGEIDGKKIQKSLIREFDKTYTEAGTVKDFIPDGYLIFKAKGALGETQFGESYIPNDNGSIQPVRGIYSYHELKKDPVALKVIFGVTGMINLQRRNDFLIAKAY